MFLHPPSLLCPQFPSNFSEAFFKGLDVGVPEGDPVIIAEDLKGVRVLVRDGEGRLYYDQRDIPEGWVALPVPEVRSANELPTGEPVEKWEQ